MYKLNTIAVGAALIALSGCTTVSLFPEEANQGTNSVADRPAAAPVDVGINWSWRIVGDEAVRPVQVFDTRGQTFLQMRPQAQEVVILSNGQVLPFQVSPPYLVLQGTPSQLDVVRDGYRAVLVRSAAQEPAQQPSLASTVPAAMPAPVVVEQGSVSRVQRVPMSQAAGQGQLASSTNTVVIEPVVSPAVNEIAPQKAEVQVPARRGRIQRVSVQ